MFITTKFFQKIFQHENSKKAYLEACKWVAINIVSITESDLHDTYWKVTREKSEIPTFKLELFASLEEHALEEHFCNVCKEFHNKFYINQEYNCAHCNRTAYMKQAENKLRIKKNYRKGLLKSNNRIL